MANRLANETSPYLLQHKDNPVDWYPWGEEALKESKEQDKPIFLSIGYSACHWCHVMEHECFENPAIAKIMNEHFINIKVDREERPDLDEIYMNAVQIMTGSGGWPMSVFLTPDLKPFYGGTYFPPTDMYGRPGFPTVLEALAKSYKERRDEVHESADELTEHIRHSFAVSGKDLDLKLELVDLACDEIMRRFDKYYGGFGGAPKFPHSMDLSILMRRYKRKPDENLLHIIDFSLMKMAKGGIYDQVGGGFHRYATDARWLIPHFEKMLYDNALLAKTYAEAYQLTKKPYYKKVIKETLDYVLREMVSPEGAFYSTQDADSEGEEGKFFAWTPQEIIDVLGEEKGNIACTYYDVTEEGNFEHKTSVLSIPKENAEIAQRFGITEEELQKIILETNCKLFAKRDQRVKPGLDDKTLTDWNGLMISAMAFCGNALHEPKYIETAQKACDFIMAKLWDNSTKRLLHTYKDGRAHTNGFLSDYANAAHGMIDAYEACRDPKYLQHAISITDAMIENFWDGTDGGFYFTGDDHETLIARSKNSMDNAVPSGNSIAVLNLLRLAEITGKTEYRNKAEKTLSVFSQMIQHFPSGFAQMLCALDFLLAEPVEIVLSANSADDIQEHQKTLFDEFLPAKVVLYNTAEHQDALAQVSQIVEGKKPVDGKPTAYVCQGFTCQKPATSIDEMKEQLAMNIGE